MNIGLVSLIANIPSVACFTIAGVMACYDKDGWGWFILIGLLISKSVERKHDVDDDDEKPDPPISCPPKSGIHRN